MLEWSSFQDLAFRVDLLTTVMVVQQLMITYLIVLVRRN